MWYLQGPLAGLAARCRPARGRGAGRSLGQPLPRPPHSSSSPPPRPPPPRHPPPHCQRRTDPRHPRLDRLHRRHRTLRGRRRGSGRSACHPPTDHSRLGCFPSLLVDACKKKLKNN